MSENKKRIVFALALLSVGTLDALQPTVCHYVLAVLAGAGIRALVDAIFGSRR